MRVRPTKPHDLDRSSRTSRVSRGLEGDGVL
jgi:hypothetical protein